MTPVDSGVTEQAPPPTGVPRRPAARRRLLIAAAVLGPVIAILALLAYGFTTEPRYIATPFIAKPAPAFTLTRFDGSVLRLEDLRGKAVFLNFWASWCPPCQFETPTIRALDGKYRDRGLVIVAVQVQQTVDAGRTYAARYGLRYTIGADVTGAVFHAYHVFALPTQFFIDPNGVLRQVVNGPLSEARASQLIESILPAGASAAPSPTH